MKFHQIACLLAMLLMQYLHTNEGSLPPPEDTYHIGMFITLVGHSHRVLFHSIARELLARGHKVTIVSGMPPGLHHPNATEITFMSEESAPDKVNMFKVTEDEGGVSFDLFQKLQTHLAQKLYEDPTIMNLYKKRDEFDVLFNDLNFNEQNYPFFVGKPFILISTAGKFPSVFSTQGNPLNPAYAPALSYYPRPWTFVNRIKNLAETLFLPIYWRAKVTNSVQNELNKHFPNIPPVVEIEGNVSLLFTNSHFSLDYAAPLLPSQLELAGLHCRPQQPLPIDIEEWIEGSGEHGVVYFSLGSVTKGHDMPEEMKRMFITVFSTLKQRVIWKFEETIADLPSNVMIRKWLPQQDIIAHPKVKVFITHGGLLGLQEAIYHSTPFIALPIFGDQPKNCKIIEDKEFGKCLSWKTVNTEIMHNSLKEVLENPKYKNSISYTSTIWKDKPMSSVEEAVWWTEYLIRNKGAPKLRSPAADLSWVEFLMLDVIFVLHVIAFVMIRVFKKIFKSLFFSNKKKPKIE